MQIALMIPCYVDLFYLRHKFTATPDSSERRKISASVYDLVEFLHDVLQVREFPETRVQTQGGFAHQLFRDARPWPGFDDRTRTRPKFSKPKQLLERVPGIEFVDFERPDECCGFGGTFSVTEEAVAARMGYDKVEFMRKAGADYIVSSDMSCLMHLQGCSSRLGTNPKVLHIAQILNGITQ